MIKKQLSECVRKLSSDHFLILRNEKIKDWESREKRISWIQDVLKFSQASNLFLILKILGCSSRPKLRLGWTCFNKFWNFLNFRFWKMLLDSPTYFSNQLFPKFRRHLFHPCYFFEKWVNFQETQASFQLPLNESLVFSPLSIAFALSLVHAGAKGNTKSQITSAICKGKVYTKQLKKLGKNFRI